MGRWCRWPISSAPAKLPDDVRAKLTALFREAIQSPEFKAVAAQGGALVDDLTGPALEKEIDSVEKSIAVVGKQVFVAEKKQ